MWESVGAAPSLCSIEPAPMLLLVFLEVGLKLSGKLGVDGVVSKMASH